jgi:hypothetical protein
MGFSASAKQVYFADEEAQGALEIQFFYQKLGDVTNK